MSNNVRTCVCPVLLVITGGFFAFLTVAQQVPERLQTILQGKTASSSTRQISQFTTGVLQSGVEMPYRAIKTNIADALNLVIQIGRRPGARK